MEQKDTREGRRNSSPVDFKTADAMMSVKPSVSLPSSAMPSLFLGLGGLGFS